MAQPDAPPEGPHMLYARAEVCKIVSSLYAALTDVSSEPIESCSREAVEDRLRDAIEARVAKRFPKLMVFRVHTAVKSTSKTGSRPGTFARPWRPVASSKGELQAIIAKKCVTRAPARAAGHATPFKIFTKDVAAAETGAAPQRGYHPAAVLVAQLYKETLRLAEEPGRVELNGCGDAAWGVANTRGSGLVCDKAGLKKVRKAARRLLRRCIEQPVPRAPQ